MGGKTLKRKPSKSEVIYDLIDKRQFKKIQNFLKPFNLLQRQAIISRSVKKEPLLYHACAIGCNNIVKYLIVECGADIEQRGRNHLFTCSPLFIAVWNKHSTVVKTLLKLGANVNIKNPNGRNIVRVAWDNKQQSMAKFLIEQGATINCEDIVRSIQYVDYIRFLLSVGIDVHLTDEQGKHPLLYAAEWGHVALVKLLLSYNANIHKMDKFGNTALSKAIQEKNNVVSDLLMASGYSEMDLALTLEYLGCKHVIFLPSLRLAKNYWRTALEIRNKISKESLALPQTDVPEGTVLSLGPEYTISDLEQMPLELKPMQFQAIIKMIRIFGARHQVTTHAIVTISTSLVHRNDFDTSFRLIEQVLLYNKEIQEPVVVLDFFRKVLYRFKSSPESDFDHTLCALNLFLGFVGDQELVQQSQLNCKKSSDKYPEANLLFLELVNLILERYSDAAKEQRLQKKVAGVVYLNEQASLETTLLHAAAINRFPTRLVSLLIRCGANVNATDETGNTPLHYVSETSDDESKRIARFLLDRGSHADTVNHNGHSPFSSLVKKGVIRDPMAYLTLQCLAARVICEHSIPYHDHCPKHLTQFVSRYSSQ